MGHLTRLAAAVALAALVSAAAAGATVWIGADATKPTLRVDAKGTAEVTFTSHGKADVVIVPARGQLYHGGSLSGPDVSKKTRVPGLPNAVVVKRTPDGRLWALQHFQTKPGAPIDLHLARWSGEPTKLALEVEDGRLVGRATYHGRGVSGTSYTLEGKRPRIYVYLDCFAGGTWRRMIGVAPKADGTFAAFIKPTCQSANRFRASLLGPNIGTTFAPNAETVVSAS